jgi:YD repeat-containing protein
MKKLSKFFLNTITMSAAIVTLSVSCSNDDPAPAPVDNTIALSDSTLHFTSKAESPKTIEVKSAVEWNVVEELDWLTVEKQGDNIIITAQPSRSLNDREGFITVVDNADPANTVIISVTQDHGTPKQYDYIAAGIPIEHLSPNGRYAAGEYDENGVVIDLYQIADDSYQPATYTVTGNPELTSEGSFVLRGVADDGTPFARGVTADGTTTVKYEKNAENMYAPYLVKNGVDTPLDFPSEYMTGSDYRGVYADLISADGKYILGRIDANGGTWIACKWTLEGTNYVFSEIAPDSVKYNPDNYRFSKFPEPANINGLSVMGEYSCGAVRVPQSGTIFAPILAKYTPYMYKMSDETMTVLDEEVDSRASFVTDNGTLFCATPYLPSPGGDRTPYVYENETNSSFSEWVNSIYGLMVENKGVVTAVAKDYSVVAWFTYEMTGYVNHFIIVEP